MIVKTDKKNQEAIASLNDWGVPLLSSSKSCTPSKPLNATELLQRLIQSDIPRLKLGVTAFFLIRSDKASAVLDTLSLLNKEESRLLKYYYTAAVYLQNFWESQWMAQGMTLLPDYFSKELGLPDPAILHGKWGLVALEEALQQTAHEPYNYISSFEALVRLLLQPRDTHATTGLS